MRYLPDVIDKLLEIIPDDQGSLKRQLESIRSSALYGPPEVQSDYWKRASFCLNQNLPYPPENEWQRKVHDIYMGVGGGTKT